MPTTGHRVARPAGDCADNRPEPRPATMRLLLIEDDPDLQVSLRRTLERKGIEIGLCADGRLALAHWQQQAPDVVLLDLSLPGLDGLEVLSQARKAGLATPVLILTARGFVPQSPSLIASMTKRRASGLADGVTASSRSRKAMSADDAIPFSIMRGLLPGIDSTERDGRERIVIEAESCRRASDPFAVNPDPLPIR